MSGYEQYVVKEKIKLIEMENVGEITLFHADSACLSEIIRYFKVHKIVYGISIFGKQYLIKFDKTELKTRGYYQ